LTYLAEITKERQLTSKAIVRLLGQKQPNGMWGIVAPREIAINNRNLNLKQLVLLELEGNVPITIIELNQILIQLFIDCSFSLTRFDRKEAEIEVFKKSLELQAIQFHARESELKKLEQLQKLQEQSLKELQLSVKKKADAVDRQYEALRVASEHYYSSNNILEKNK
jgi:hypothetical protein